MQITLNGALREIPDAWTISDLLAELNIESRYCAVERNRHVVPRETHRNVTLLACHQTETVTHVGGG